MQRLLKICGSFARDHCPKFKLQKRKLISFRKRQSIYCKETNFSINGEHLLEVHDVTHLGHKLSAFAREPLVQWKSSVVSSTSHYTQF